jgi:hypothetical protein
MAIDHPFDHPDDPSVSVWTDEASNLSRPDPSGADQIDAEHPSRSWPIPTLWWLRPVMSATRVGEHNAVVWNRVYFSPWPATRSAVGISHGPPKALPAPNPTSSNNTSNTFGAPSGRPDRCDGRKAAVGVAGVMGDQPRIAPIRDRQHLTLDILVSHARHLHPLTASWCTHMG